MTGKIIACCHHEITFEEMEKGQQPSLCLNDHIAHYMKSDEKFIEGIKKGVQACEAGRKKSWTQIKQELNLR